MTTPALFGLPRRRACGHGFTLIEVVIVLSVIAILVAAATPMIVQRVAEARIATTREEARALHEAMVGRPDQPGNFGFVGDLGMFPATFDQLVRPGGLPTYTTRTMRGIGMGWRGPYINRGSSADDVLFDAWGRPYTGAWMGQVRSAGPDGLAGTMDDIVHAPSSPLITGDMLVTVKTILLGKPVVDPAGYAVDVYYSAGGVEAVVRDVTPPYRFDRIPMGLHAVVVVKTVDPGANTLVAQDTVVLRGGTTLPVELWF